jgi:hypothetical protein
MQCIIQNMHAPTLTYTQQVKSIIYSRFSPTTMLTFSFAQPKKKKLVMFCTHWGWIWAHETLELLLCDIICLGLPRHSLCDVLHFSLHRMPHHINFPAQTSDYLPVCRPVKCGITVMVPNFLDCEDLFLNSKIFFTEPSTILTVLSASDDWGNTLWQKATNEFSNTFKWISSLLFRAPSTHILKIQEHYFLDSFNHSSLTPCHVTAGSAAITIPIIIICC